MLATGRPGQAVDLAEGSAAGESPPTPQWRVIERVTTADALARAGDEHAAVSMLSAALSDAETLRLPHQVQRCDKLESGQFTVRDIGNHAPAGQPLARAVNAPSESKA